MIHFQKKKQTRLPFTKALSTSFFLYSSHSSDSGCRRTQEVIVISDLTIKRNSKESLILDGRGHKVFEVSINGKLIPREHYKVTPHELILIGIPDDEISSVDHK